MATAAAAGAAATPAPPAAAREQVVGVWRLVSYELKDKASGAVTHPYTNKPVGRITYDRAGRMSAQLMRPGRVPLAGDVPGAAAALIVARATEAELREMVGGFIAYFGTYKVLDSERTLVHRVEGCLLPNWVGTELRRTFEFSADGKQLTLTADAPRVVGRLVWEREPG